MFRKAEKVRRPIQSAKPNLKSPLVSPDPPSMATARMADRDEVVKPSPLSSHQNNHGNDDGDGDDGEHEKSPPSSDNGDNADSTAAAHE